MAYMETYQKLARVPRVERGGEGRASIHRK